jgi:hypothetical protein
MRDQRTELHGVRGRRGLPERPGHLRCPGGRRKLLHGRCSVHGAEHRGNMPCRDKRLQRNAVGLCLLAARDTEHGPKPNAGSARHTTRAGHAADPSTGLSEVHAQGCSDACGRPSRGGPSGDSRRDASATRSSCLACACPERPPTQRRSGCRPRPRRPAKPPAALTVHVAVSLLRLRIEAYVQASALERSASRDDRLGSP